MELNSQHKLVLAWIDEHGSILPAKMAGVVYQGEMFGSETSKRCRELRQYSYLYSEREGQFTRFFRTAPKLPPLKPRICHFIDLWQKKNTEKVSRAIIITEAVKKGYRPIEVSNTLDTLEERYRLTLA